MVFLRRMFIELLLLLLHERSWNNKADYSIRL